MPKPNHLWRRNGVYYVRKRVPQYLVERLGRSEINKSLKTKDLNEAKRRSIAELAKIDLAFQMAESEASKHASRSNSDLATLSLREISRMVDEWYDGFRQNLVKNWSFRAPGCMEDVLQEQLDDQEVERDQTIVLPIEDSTDAACSGDQYPLKTLEDMVSSILVHHGFPSRPRKVVNFDLNEPEAIVDKSSERYSYIREQVNAAHIELMRSYLEYLKGSSLKILSHKPISRPEATLSELTEAFLADPRKVSINAKRLVDYRMAFRILLETLGQHKPLSELSRSDMREVAEVIRRIPKHCSKKLPGVTFAEAIEIADRKGFSRLSDTTVRDHLQKIGSVLKWATDEDLIDRNLARGLADTGVGHHTIDQRHPFTIDDLQLIFSDRYLTTCDRNRGRARFWVPLIALFHGMRLNEIYQLGVKQVRCENSIWTMQIEPSEAGQRVKTSSSIRRVPDHPEVIDLGFLDYVRRSEATGAMQVLPELPMSTTGYRSRKITRRFSSYLEDCGVSDAKKSFHSLRHTWRDAARENGLNPEAADQIGGWAIGGVSAKYGFGHSLVSLKSELEKIRFTSLDLSHLHR